MRKRTPAYKQLSFETAIRNPERYIKILKTLKKFEGVLLNDKNLLEIVCQLYKSGIVSNRKINIKKTTKIEEIEDAVKEVNSTRKADGGFPNGYQSRFWTYMRTPSEFGFVFAQYKKKLKLSSICKKLVNGDIDEQEAFSIQAMKFNRKSPYKNVENDFNFFKFILKTLLELNKKDKGLSYRQFILATFNKDENVKEFLQTIKNHKFNKDEDVFNFAIKITQPTTNINTGTKDYPDVVLRVLIICGFVSVRYVGVKMIFLNKNKIKYIDDLLKINFHLTNEEKKDPTLYFEKLNKAREDEMFLNIAVKHRFEDKIVGEEYTNKLYDIIERNKIDQEKIIDSINKLEKTSEPIEEFKEIPAPLKLEFYISILIALKYKNELYIKPNYKADHLGKPYSHAPSNIGDIEIYSTKVYWLIEVTLIRNKTQQFNNETTSVIRHLFSELSHEYKNKYLSFIAPIVHEDTKQFFDISTIINKDKTKMLGIKTYTIDEFINTTVNKTNFADMEGNADKIFSKFRKNLGQQTTQDIFQSWDDDIQKNGHVVIKYGEWQEVGEGFKSWGEKKQKVRIVSQVNAGKALHIAEEDLLGYIFFNDFADVDTKKDYALQIDGDSMNEKRINDKLIEEDDYVLVKPDYSINSGDTIVAIDMDGAVNVKEFYKDEDGGMLKSKSKNKENKNINVDSTEYTNLGKVVDVIKYKKE